MSKRKHEFVINPSERVNIFCFGKGLDGYVPIEQTENETEDETIVPRISTDQNNDRRREDEVREEQQRRRQEEEEEERLRKQQQFEEEERRRNDKLNEINHKIVEDPIEATTIPAETTQRTTRRRPIQENKVEPICKLPVEPEVDVDFDAGYRFGTSTDSRIEFTQIPSKIKRAYDISLQFKTTSSDGVLFYAADSRHTDFIALYLQDGKVIALKSRKN